MNQDELERRAVVRDANSGYEELVGDQQSKDAERDIAECIDEDENENGEVLLLFHYFEIAHNSIPSVVPVHGKKPLFSLKLAINDELRFTKICYCNAYN